MDEFIPTTQTELQRFVADNAREAKTALYPAGGRTALQFGYSSERAGTTVSMTKLDRVIDYPVRDMTITVEAGIRMDELSALLKQEGQQLPIDVAQSGRATLGGAVATNTSGPRRFGYGTFRDYVIGVSAVDAQGRLFSAGGRVVKNVAGYDLCKLLVGSMGTLAIITQLTLKLKPVPETSSLLWLEFDSYSEIDGLLERLLTSAARPTILETLNPPAARQVVSDARIDLPIEKPILCIGVEGPGRQTDWQIETLKNESKPCRPKCVHVVGGDEASRLLAALSEFQVCSDDPLSFQANLLPSKTLEFVADADRAGISLQAHAGNGIVIGHLPDEASTVEQAGEMLDSLRRSANACGGNLIILNCDDDWKPRLPLFGTEEPSQPLMKRIKSTLDPHDLLNPRRFVVNSA